MEQKPNKTQEEEQELIKLKQKLQELAKTKQITNQAQEKPTNYLLVFGLGMGIITLIVAIYYLVKKKK